MERYRAARRRGFMLAEICTVMAISLALAAWVIPSLHEWHSREQIRAAARALARTLSLARSEAVARQAPVTVCRSDGAGQCILPGRPCATGALDWSCGWLVQTRQPGVGAWPILLHTQPAVSDVTITGSTTEMRFLPPAGLSAGSFRGFAVRAARASPRIAALHVRLAAGGRALIHADAYRR